MLTERQLEIIFAVVYEYIKTGEPVGSRTISRKFLKSHSAATIRNEMSDLEEMGYFSQPHSSAGRLPTSMAYRVYVNSILHRPSSPPPEISRWVHRVADQLQSLDERLAEAARFLARFTRCFSVAAVSALEGLKLRKADFIRLAPEILLILLVVENGAVHHSRVRVSPDVTQEQLERLASVIDHIAGGVPWNGARGELLEYLSRAMAERWRDIEDIFIAIDEMMSDDGLTLSTGGMREVLEDFISDYAASEGLKVTIGDENERPAMQNCSVMMSTATGGGRKAVVGLVGPLRMNYENSIAVLEAVLNGLNRPVTEKEEP